MATPSKGIEVNLDKKRHLRFPLGVLRDIDENSDMVEILYLGLKHEDPELTEEQVGEIIDLETLPEISEELKKATGGLIDVHAIFGLAEESAEGNVTTEEPTG